MSRQRTLLRSACVLACVALLGGCALLGRGNGEKATVFAPEPRVAADPSWPEVDWQLAITPPTATRTVDTFRIAVRPVPGELQVYANASWARSPTDMLEDTVLRALEDSGRIPGVARRGSGLAPDYRMLLDLRRFEADYAGAAVPAATIEVHAKLLHALDQGIVAARTFRVAIPARGTQVEDTVAAFTSALEAVGGQLAGWALEAGTAHAGQQAGIPPPSEEAR
jgi:cholesterol transport system auxiliary component